MTGSNNKRRFSLLMPQGRVERFGSCNPQDDDNALVVFIDGKYYIERYLVGDPDRVTSRVELASTTQWTNGYYDKEHDGWKPLSEFK